MDERYNQELDNFTSKFTNYDDFIDQETDDKPINSVQAKATLMFALLTFLTNADSSLRTALTQSLPQPT